MKTLSLFCCLILLSGCQILNRDTVSPSTTTTPINVSASISNINYAHYYLWLKAQTQKQLASEYKALSNTLKVGEQLKLALLYAQPQFNEHNIFNAKDILNQHKKFIQQFEKGSTAQRNNYAFFTLLNDQLNQHILLINNESMQQSRLAELESGINQLSRQIEQLKNIENTINTRGQQNGK